MIAVIALPGCLTNVTPDECSLLTSEEEMQMRFCHVGDDTPTSPVQVVVRSVRSRKNSAGISALAMPGSLATVGTVGRSMNLRASRFREPLEQRRFCLRAYPNGA